jgi:hypothetical protein
VAHIPPIKFIAESDFKNEEFKTLLKPLNQFIRAVSNALQNGLTVSDKIAAQVNDLTLLIAQSLYVWTV